MGLNGALGGLVGITANCDCVTNIEALHDRWHRRCVGPDGRDPARKAPHRRSGRCLAGPRCVRYLGWHRDRDLRRTTTWAFRCSGSLVIPAWSFVTMFVLFAVLRAVGFLRVSEEEEQLGLDISEHGMQAYGPAIVSAARPAVVARSKLRSHPSGSSSALAWGQKDTPMVRGSVRLASSGRGF